MASSQTQLKVTVVAALILLVAFAFHLRDQWFPSTEVPEVSVAEEVDQKEVELVASDRQAFGSLSEHGVPGEPFLMFSPPEFDHLSPIADMRGLVAEYNADGPKNLFDMWTEEQRLVLTDLGLVGFAPWENAVTALSEDPRDQEARLYILETLQLARNYYEGLIEGERYLSPEYLPIHATTPLD